jgi:hypothetical protein
MASDTILANIDFPRVVRDFVYLIHFSPKSERVKRDYQEFDGRRELLSA